MPESLLQRLFNSTSQTFNRILSWDRLPLRMGVVPLYGIRDRLRALNLHDQKGLSSQGAVEAGPCDPAALVSRTADGTYNDLGKPTMGAAGTRFGRNFPLDQVYPDEGAILDPNPRTVSRDLLTRHQFEPATTLNLLAAAWIQFMVHDWFHHGKNDKAHFFDIPLSKEDPWPEHPMRVPRTRPDPTRPPNAKDGPPTFVNTVTHWWDGSQVYGSSREEEARLRSGKDGKLKIGDDGLLPLDANGIDDTGINDNWWVGLSMFHTIFVREHNAICDKLRSVYPTWSDQDLYLRARLINAALLAKIHTVEWTPAILGHPTIKFSMEGGWWGILGKQVTDALGRFGSGDILSGIPGSTTEHFAADFALTEEFVSVYRMHSLMPDDFRMRSAKTDEPVFPKKDRPPMNLRDVSGKQTRGVMNATSLEDLFYSFGTSHPGALTLHNYPKFLQTLQKDDGSLLDLASIDILRDRERGIPRYNRFRRLLHMPPARSFEDITENRKFAEELRQVYNNDIEKVDAMVGMLAESRRPKGFGFGETAFRIFLLMAPRRLKSDRFFSKDFTPQVYTQTGIDWIRDNSFAQILIRHVPGVHHALAPVENPFAPWPRTKQS
jgi:hypothetical protein